MCRAQLSGFSIAYDDIATSKKNEIKPHLKKCWCIPKDQDAAFVAAMEDVLAVYARPYDSEYPVVCMDEKPVQFFANARKSLHSKDCRIEYEDNEYIRNEQHRSFYLQNHSMVGVMQMLRNIELNRTGRSK